MHTVVKHGLGAFCALALVLSVVAPALAQQPAPPHQPPRAGPHGQAAPAPGGASGGMGMCPMMTEGGMMGGGMGMHGMMGAPADPKAHGRMLQMRGEILKAVGDVLVKYGQTMESEAAKK